MPGSTASSSLGDDIEGKLDAFGESLSAKLLSSAMLKMTPFRNTPDSTRRNSCRIMSTQQLVKVRIKIKWERELAIIQLIQCLVYRECKRQRGWHIRLERFGGYDGKGFSSNWISNIAQRDGQEKKTTSVRRSCELYRCYAELAGKIGQRRAP